MDGAGVCLLGAIGFCAALPAGLLIQTGKDDAPALAGLPGAVELDAIRAALQKAAFVERFSAAANGSRKRSECLAELPVMLDVVTLGLSAGLSFDSSLGLYCARYHNELAQALLGAMLSWQIGVCTREEALRGLEEELGIAAMGRFAHVVGESLTFGTPLAEALEHQAQAIRDEQRAQVEEEIEKVPVKMLVPLGTLIVPAMLLAILGPLLGSALVVG